MNIFTDRLKKHWQMKYFILSLSIFLLYSCSKQEQVTDTKKIIFNEEANPDFFNTLTCKFIPLETNDSCLFNDIKEIQIVDNKIYIIDNKRSKLLVFDISGKFITQIGNLGNGPGEYLTPSNFNIDKEKQTITIADVGQSKLLYYDLNNYQYIKSQKAFYFSNCSWLPDGNIAWAIENGYDSGKRDPHYVKITDSNLNTVNLLYPTDFKPEYLMVAGSFFYTFNQNCYLNLPFIPTIYKVTSQKITPVYELDFGKQKFASMEWLKREAEKNYYGTISKTEYISTQTVKETDDYICVVYYAQGLNAYIGFYNKKNGESIKLKGSDFAKHTNLYGLSQVKDTYNNFFLFSMLACTLKTYKSSLPELQPIIKDIKEDDNPVICLLKFN